MLVHGALRVPIAESSKVNKTKAGKGKKMRGKEGVICVLVAISSHGSSQQQQYWGWQEQTSRERKDYITARRKMLLWGCGNAGSSLGGRVAGWRSCAELLIEGP